MNYNFNDDIPINSQIQIIIKEKILKADFHPGQNVLSIRELSQKLSVNPNIVTKAIEELQKTGLLYISKDDKIVVTEDLELIQDYKNDYALKLCNDFISEIDKLNLKSDLKAKILHNIEVELND